MPRIASTAPSPKERGSRALLLADRTSPHRRATGLFLVVRIPPATVIRCIAHRRDLRHPLPQRLLHAVLERHVDHAAPMAATPELQQHGTIRTDLEQTHLPAMRGDP